MKSEIKHSILTFSYNLRKNYEGAYYEGAHRQTIHVQTTQLQKS